MAFIPEDPEVVTRTWGSLDRHVEVSDKLIQLLDFLLPNGISPSELPDGYKPVCEAIAGFFNNPTEKLKEYRREVKLAKQGLPLAKMNQEFLKIVKRYKKRLTMEQVYNRVCNEYPEASYSELHEYLIRRERIPAGSLRVYKKRRIEITNDLRDDKYASIKEELKTVKDCFIQNGYRLTNGELLRSCRLEKKNLNRILSFMKKQGLLGMSKERKNGKITDVLVLLIS